MKLYTPSNKTQFLEILEQYSNVIIQFSASWCGPCKRVTPSVHKLLKSVDGDDVCYIYCDLDNFKNDAPEILSKITSIPAFSVYSSVN